MRRGIPYGSLETESLVKLVKLGVDSPVLQARLRYAAAEGFRRYAKGFAEAARVYPNYLPTQSSGRWSITNPPLVNLPDAAKAAKRGLPDLQACVWPDIGTWWLCYDWNAMHAVFMAAVSDDLLDIQAFRDELDIHTSTCCAVYKLPLPPDLKDPHKAEVNAAWRKRVDWQGKGDRRRHLMKTTRFALLNAFDEKGVMEAKDVEELGLTMDQLLRAGREFLRAKPNMVAWKEKFARDAIARGEARSLYGRRRKLFGSHASPEGYREKFKTAVSHFLQGTEVDIMEQTLIEVTTRFPECRLAWPSHDGTKLVFPTGTPVEVVFPAIKAIVERPREIGRHVMPMWATWEIIREGGEHISL